MAALIAALAGPAAAIALSACSVLVYYAVINLAALRLRVRGMRRWIAALGVLLCVLLAFLLPLAQLSVVFVDADAAPTAGPPAASLIATGQSHYRVGFIVWMPFRAVSYCCMARPAGRRAVAA
jgi:hypothetical protein